MMCTCSLLSNPNQEERNITFRMPFRVPTFRMPTFRVPTFRMPTFNMPTFRVPFRVPTFRMPTFNIEPHEWEVLWEVLGMESYGIYSRWLVLGRNILLLASLTYLWSCSMIGYMVGHSFAICYGVGV